MRKIMVLLVVLTCFISIGGVANAKHKDDFYQEKVDTVVKQLMQQYDIPGAAIAVIDGEHTYTYLFGTADITSGKPVAENTIFEVGSITKLFTALLCAEAEDNGRIKLEDTVTKYCPQFSESPTLSNISFTNALTHTAGFSLNMPKDITQENQPIEYYLSKWQPQKPIGSQWQYSNVGIGLAASALENQSNKSINDLIRTNILEPLAMTPLGLEVPKEYQNDFAQGYTSTGKVATHAQGDFPGAWGLKATIHDMSKFMAAAIGRPNTPTNIENAMHNTQTPRLSVGNMQQALAWQVHSLQNQTMQPEPENMNLGPLPVQWFPKDKQSYRSDVLLDKTGATPGFRSYIAVIPRNQVGVVILTNKYISNGAIVNAGRTILGLEKQPEKY